MKHFKVGLFLTFLTYGIEICVLIIEILVFSYKEWKARKEQRESDEKEQSREERNTEDQKYPRKQLIKDDENDELKIGNIDP